MFWAMPCHLYRGVCHVFFVINVVTSTSMQSSYRNIADFGDLEFHSLCPAVIFMPCIHVATVRSMLLLGMISKDVLYI